MPGVTVGLPVGAGVYEFELAVRSVFAQTYTDWELLIVCDGSPDDVVQRALQVSDSRVRVIVHPENRGLAFRLNELAGLAAADFIARMDADDMMHPDRLARTLKFLAANPQVDVVGSGSYLINSDNTVQGAYREPGLPNKLSGYLNSGVFSHPTVTFKKAWAIQNPYDPTRIRTEDKELWLRTAATSSFAKLTDRLLFCKVPLELSVAKQALTAEYDRKLVRELGPKVASNSQIASKVIKSWLKQIVFGLAQRCGLLPLIYRSKFHALSPVEKMEATAAVEKLTRTPVPGWDGDRAVDGDQATYRSI